MNFSNIGERLKYLRTNHKLTQEEVGERINVSKQTLYKYENGIITNIPSDKIELLADIYNVSPAYLMGWEKESNPIPLPSLTPKDEQQIAKDLEAMISSLGGAAAMGNPDDAEDMEMLKASLETAMRLSKRIAKKKYTPKKYRKE
jgi:transcriptional regulator with XRE-family HTH domain